MIKKLTKARVNLLIKQPFFGSLALSMKFVASDIKDLAVTDGNTIKYGDISELSLAQTEGLLAGLTMHRAMLHHLRRGNRNVKKWNKACDLAINPILKECGFTLPNDDVNTSYAGRSAEEIYGMLISDESDDNESDNNGEVEDNPAETKAEVELAENDAKEAFAQAVYTAKQAGNLPASLERLLEQVLETHTPWREVLRRFLTEKAPLDDSWSRPNRRFVAQGIYLPTRSNEEEGDIVIAIDTSGSLSKDQLEEFGAEINAIVTDVNARKTTVIYCDSHINHIDEFNKGDPVVLNMHGGGGTAFTPPFNHLEQNGITPKAFIYFTDGYGNFPEQEPSYPVLWAINSNVKPPWGEHIPL